MIRQRTAPDTSPGPSVGFALRRWGIDSICASREVRIQSREGVAFVRGTSERGAYGRKLAVRYAFRAPTQPFAPTPKPPDGGLSHVFAGGLRSRVLGLGASRAPGGLCVAEPGGVSSLGDGAS